MKSLQDSYKLDKNYKGYAPDKVLHSKACNFKVKSAILPKFELVRFVLPLHVTCKGNFHKDPIRPKQAMLRTRSNTGFSALKGKQLYRVNGPI